MAQPAPCLPLPIGPQPNRARVTVALRGERTAEIREQCSALEELKIQTDINLGGIAGRDRAIDDKVVAWSGNEGCIYCAVRLEFVYPGEPRPERQRAPRDRRIRRVELSTEEQRK